MNGTPPWRRRLHERIAARATVERSRSRRYAVALVLALAAGAARLLAGDALGERALLAFCYPAVVVSAAYGGFGAGVITTAVSFGLTAFLVGPALSSDAPAALRYLTFVVTGLLVSLMSDLLRHGARQLRTLEAERWEQDERQLRERSRALETERRARREAEASEARHRLLAEASAVLASSKDHDADLRELAQRLVPGFGSACVLDILQPEGRIMRRVATVHAEPGASALLEELCEACNAGTGPPDLARMLRAEQPELASECGAGWLGSAPPGRARDLLEQLDIGSALSVPVRARGRPMGVMTLMAGLAGRRYDEQDLAFAADLGERIGMALENARLLAEAQRLNRVKDEFLAVLSHELRTPLGAILLWTGLLEAESLDAGPSRAVEMIDRSTRQLSQLIDELLDVSRIVAGKLSLNPHATNLPALLESVVESVRPSAEGKGLRLRLTVSGEFANTWGDSSRLRQAFENVLLNAVKFTQEGEVAVSLQRVRRCARVRFQDTGAGIRPEVLPFVFERFRQGDSSSTRGQGGLGLGLAIAKHIVELHGGRIEAWSDGEGRGSAFTIEIPLSLPPASFQPVSDPRNTERPLAARRVLVVDDHRDTLQGLTLALESSGAEVLAASSAQEGLEGLESFHPDVIVSDLAMPQRDGYDFIRAVRGLPSESGGRTPAVAVSAYASAEDRQRALQAGFQEHLAKPVDVSRLVQALARLLGAGPPPS